MMATDVLEVIGIVVGILLGGATFIGLMWQLFLALFRIGIILKEVTPNGGSSLKDQISGLKQDVSTVKDSVTTLKKDVSDVKQSVTDLTKKQDEQTERLKRIEDTKAGQHVPSA